MMFQVLSTLEKPLVYSNRQQLFKTNEKYDQNGYEKSYQMVPK